MTIQLLYMVLAINGCDISDKMCTQYGCLLKETKVIVMLYYPLVS